MNGPEIDRPAMLSDLVMLKGELQAQIAGEAAETRRHFAMVAERLESHLKLVAEVNVHHRTVLDDHEARLQSIERRR